MKEEELLLFKEELARIKMSRWGFWGVGVVWIILGLGFARPFLGTDLGLYRLIIVTFGAIGIICCIIAELKYGRDYQDKLKELKQQTKNNK